MKKIKWLVTVLVVANLLLGVIGCKDPEIHIHTYSEAWTSDASGHWHAATCGHKDEVIDKAAHTFGDRTITKEATCTQEGKKTVYCTVCEYEKEETIPAKGHSRIWEITKEATCTQEGKKTVYCTVCEYEKEETIPAKGHSRIWEITKEPTETESGKMQRVCKECGETVTKELQPAPEGFRFVKGVTITGTESWIPESRVFVSGRSLTIPDLIVSDHEVTRGEYTDVMGSDPSYGSAYDKDGNELEGDAVLNNPVNRVTWYDALVYCNKLSMQENLTPCYTINSSTNPDDWGAVPTDYKDPLRDTWDAATCNWNANGYRLPTEAEWEWLARGGEKYKYAGSDNVDDVAWYKSNTNNTGRREVKTKAPNGYGLYDMSGNVSEWCWDWDGSISDSSAADGASSGSYRVCRGGGWTFADYVSVFIRGGSDPSDRYFSLSGFRVVRPSSID